MLDDIIWLFSACSHKNSNFYIMYFLEKHSKHQYDSTLTIFLGILFIRQKIVISRKNTFLVATKLQPVQPVATKKQHNVEAMQCSHKTTTLKYVCFIPQHVATITCGFFSGSTI